MKRLEFELVLPCYNEGKTVGRLLRDVTKAAVEAGHTPETFQLVLVQNGSRDNTGEELERLKGEYGEWFRVVTISVNQGYGFGLWQGLLTTTAPDVGWSHADLQCSMKDVFLALAVLKGNPGLNIVRGTRIDRDFKDRMVSRVFELLSRLILGLKCAEVNAQPKVFHREFLSELKSPPPHFGFDLYALYRAAKAQYGEELIPVSFPPRVHGVSNWAGTVMGRYRTILGMIRFMAKLLIMEGRVSR